MNASNVLRVAWLVGLILAVCLFLGLSHGHGLQEHVSLTDDPSLIAGLCLVAFVAFLRRPSLPVAIRATTLLRVLVAWNVSRLPLQRARSPSIGARASPIWLQRFLA